MRIFGISIVRDRAPVERSGAAEFMATKAVTARERAIAAKAFIRGAEFMRYHTSARGDINAAYREAEARYPATLPPE